MFIARAKIMKSVKNLGIGESDFAPFQSNTDGTLPHAMERFFGIAATNNGYEIRDVYTPWWRKRFQSAVNALTPPVSIIRADGIKNIRVLVFPRAPQVAAVSIGFGRARNYGVSVGLA